MLAYRCISPNNFNYFTPPPKIITLFGCLPPSQSKQSYQAQKISTVEKCSLNPTV